jgi:hypothetical protein
VADDPRDELRDRESGVDEDGELRRADSSATLFGHALRVGADGSAWTLRGVVMHRK